MKELKRYFKYWLLMSRNAFISTVTQRYGMLFFFLGKIIRFFIFVVAILFVLKGTKTIAGYDTNQIIFFFLTFNLIDVVSQFLFREVYRFRPLVVSGGFDLTLVKPINALFRSLMGGADILDMLTIPPLIIAIIIIGQNFNPSFVSSLYYFFLLLNGLLISTAFHIAVLGLGIITMEIDHTVMIYRDLMSLGRFPIDIYKQPLQGIITYLIPVGIMITIPAKAYMGLLSWPVFVGSLMFGIGFFLVALRFWSFALKKYSSASS